MPIYTRFGDKGYSSIIGGISLPKDEDIFEAIGTIDELNAIIGFLRSYLRETDIVNKLKIIQEKLTNMNVELVSRYGKKINRYRKYFIKKEDVDDIEKIIDRYEKMLPEIRDFIIYGGSVEASLMYYVRAICRRAERRAVSLSKHIDLSNSFIIPYLNRLGDLLFIYGRYLNHLKGVKEEYWRHEGRRI